MTHLERIDTSSDVKKARGNKPKLKIGLETNKNGKLAYVMPEGITTDEAYKNTFGIIDHLIVSQVTTLSSLTIFSEDNPEKKIGMVISWLKEFEPGDAFETQLCTKAIALWEQGMGYLCMASRSESLDKLEVYQKFAIKLLRLHNETIECLMRYRRKGEQKVIVQHVNVNSGGQAVIAGTMDKGGGDEKI